MALDSNAEYHRAFDSPDFTKVSAKDLDRHKMLPFSSIDDVSAIVEELGTELQKLRGQGRSSEMKMVELQSRMLKSMSGILA